MEKDEDGRYVVELNETAAVLVEQIENEITVCDRECRQRPL